METSVTQKALFHKISAFIALKPQFFCKNMVFEKYLIVCPFGGSLIVQKWCTLLFHNLKRPTPPKKNPLKPLYFFAASRLLRQSLKNQPLLLGGENENTNWAHWCYRGPKNLFFLQAKSDVSETTIFCRLLVANALDFVPFLRVSLLGHHLAILNLHML